MIDPISAMITIGAVSAALSVVSAASVFWSKMRRSDRNEVTTQIRGGEIIVGNVSAAPKDLLNAVNLVNQSLNLSLQPANTGDNASALATMRESVEVYRRLAEENPERFA